MMNLSKEELNFTQMSHPHTHMSIHNKPVEVMVPRLLFDGGGDVDYSLDPTIQGVEV